MTGPEILADGFGRLQRIVHAGVEGLDEEALAYRVDAHANSIAWLVWHLTRGQDAQVAAVAGTGQAWHDDGFAGRFGLPFDDSATGYGHTSEEVAAVRASASLLGDYYDAAHTRTLAFLAGLADADLDRVVDASWTPAVTLGVRLTSILVDDLQHAGQASYVRGIVERR